MVHFYYESKGKVLGPYSLSEIRAQKIQPTTLVWRYGLDIWKPAHEIEELRQIFFSAPPPLPAFIEKAAIEKTPTKTAEVKKAVLYETPIYDLKYRKETEASVTGVFLIISPLLFIVSYKQAFASSEYFYSLQIITITGAVIIRYIATAWVLKIARNQNRDFFKWGVCSLFIPGVTLMVIGHRKKLYDAHEWKKYLYNDIAETGTSLFHKAATASSRYL
jgi:hypothetical protein